MKRIALLIESLEAGGAQRQLTGLATMLAAEGHAVKVFCYYHRDFYLPELRGAGVEYEYVRDDRRHLTRIPRLAAALRRFRPDTVIAYLDTPAMMACIIKKAVLAKWKLIVSERNTTQRLSRKERLKFRLYRHADLIVPNSHSQARFIESHYPGLTPKLKVITNFVDTDYFSPLPDREWTPELPGTFRIVGVGRIVPQKNILELIRALGWVKENGPRNFRVDWYGERYSDDYQARCLEAVEQLGLQDHFQFHEPTRSIRDIYRHSHAFCLPSIFEGFPNVLCEAMSCGLPVLCSNVCDNPDIADNRLSGFLFSPHIAEVMADAIINMLLLQLDGEKLREMGDYNRRKAVDAFSRDRFLREYNEII